MYRKNRYGYGWVIGVVAAVVVVAAILYVAVPRTSYTSVESTTWNYTVNTRQKTLAAGEGWGLPKTQCNGFCEQPFNVTCEVRLMGTHSCMCNNQHVCQQCPTYGNWCKYEYYDWPVVASYTSGGHEKTFFWPETPPLLDDQRHQRIESYTIVFKAMQSGKRWTYEPNGVDDYRQFNVGEPWKLSTHPGFSTATPKKKLTAEQ